MLEIAQPACRSSGTQVRCYRGAWPPTEHSTSEQTTASNVSVSRNFSTVHHDYRNGCQYRDGRQQAAASPMAMTFCSTATGSRQSSSRRRPDQDSTSQTNRFSRRRARTAGFVRATTGRDPRKRSTLDAAAAPDVAPDLQMVLSSDGRCPYPVRQRNVGPSAGHVAGEAPAHRRQPLRVSEAGIVHRRFVLATPMPTHRRGNAPSKPLSAR